MTLVLLSPLQGWSAPLEETPDRVFAERMLGDGLAIDPTGEAVFAPFNGVVTAIAPTSHAVSLRSDAGVEVLIHIGLETVALQGRGFDPAVAAGARVAAGDRLIGFDLNVLAREARSLLTPVVVTNSDAFPCVWRRQDHLVAVGEPLMTLTQVGAGPARRTGVDGPAGAARRLVRIGLPHGLHARPAAAIAAQASRFEAELELHVRGRQANLKSPVAILTLGAAHGEAAELRARGSDAEAAILRLAGLLEAPDAGGGVPPSPATDPAPPGADRGPGHAVDRTGGSAGVRQGVAASPGVAVGPLHQLRRDRPAPRRVQGGPESETARLSAARFAAQAALAAEAAGQAVGGDVLLSHLELVADPELRRSAEGLIHAGASAGAAWMGALDAQIEVLAGARDPRIRARTADLEDVKRRVLTALEGPSSAPAAPPEGAIVVADDVLPSELLALKDRIAGVCTAAGGPTSHLAIIASGLGLPLVVAAGPEVLAAPDGAAALVDGSRGRLIIHPSTEEIEAAIAACGRDGARGTPPPPGLARGGRTRDGAAVPVMANLGDVAEARAARAAGAEGCGLLRTEFLFLDRDAAPDEAEQHLAYQAVAEAMGPSPLTIRTLDVGGDKPARFMELPFEANPALGVRGVRISLLRRDLLRAQLRAVLRTGAGGEVRVMAPMVSSLAELLEVRRTLEAEAAALGRPTPPLGVMVETPAAALTTRILSSAADFFSIGTNDLTQYALAMDRGNAALAAEIDALHPAVVRLIALACEGAAASGRPVAVCGAIASDPLAAPLLVGLGVSALSAAPARVGEVRAALADWSLPECRALAAAALSAVSAKAVRQTIVDRAIVDRTIVDRAIAEGARDDVAGPPGLDWSAG